MCAALTTMYLPPAPGDAFSVLGRRDLLTVAQLIASFTSEARGESRYLVQTPAGARWILIESDRADGPRWMGRPVPADTNEAIHMDETKDPKCVSYTDSAGRVWQACEVGGGGVGMRSPTDPDGRASSFDIEFTSNGEKRITFDASSDWRDHLDELFDESEPA